MLHLILGGCGTGKSARMIEALRPAPDAAHKTAVLLPDQFGFEGERRLCKELGTQRFNQIETYTFQTLSREILTQAGSGKAGSYASDQEKLIYLAQAAQQCEEQKLLEQLGRRVGSSDFIMELSRLITKFRKAAVTGEQLITVSASLPDRLARKTQDIGQILLAYERILTEHDRNDSLVNLTAAAQLAEDSAFFRERAFFIDEFDSFTGDQYRLLSVMLAQSPEVTAVIRCDDPGKRPTGIFLGGNRTVFQFRKMAEEYHIPVQQEYLGTYLRSPHEDLALVGTQLLRRHTRSAAYAGHVHIAKASDPAAEVEYICARICDLLEHDPTLHCRDIAVAVKQPEVYDPLFSRAMVRYGLPFDTTEAKSVLYTDLIRHTLCLFDLLRGKGWDTDLLLRYIKAPFSGYYADTTAMLEHFCFTWDIDREDWDKPFWTADDEAFSLAAGFGGETLEKLRVRLTKEITELRLKCRGRSVRVVCGEIFSHLSRRKKAYDTALSQMNPNQQKDFVMIWNLLCDILDTLVTCHGEQVLSMKQLYDQFLLLVQSSSFSVPPQTLDSIHIADAQTARFNDPKILFIPGVIEGVLPGDVSAGGMFTQQDLRSLEEHEISVSRLLPELHSDELMIAVKLLCAPSEQVYLTYPSTAQDGEACVPSSVIGEILGMFPPDTPLLTDADAMPVSFFVRSLESAYYTYVRRMNEASGELSALRELLAEDPVYAAKLRKLRSEQDEPKASPETMQKLLGSQIILSPSGIETFHQCAFQYFCRYVLRLYVPERVTFSAQNIGNYAHYCLEQILRDTPMEEFLSLDRNGLSALIGTYSQRFSETNFSDALRRSGRFQMNYSSAGSSLLELLVYMQRVFRDEKFRPVGYEVNVSTDPQEGDFPALSLENGSILCKGKIDRVDVYSDAQTRLLRVVDYKTGDKSLDPVKLGYGQDMQMLVYLFALEQSGAFGGASPSGVLYLPSGQLRQDRYEARAIQNRGREEILGDYYMSRGLLLDSAAPYMDQRIREAAKPVRLADKKDALYTVTQEQMTHLEDHVRSTICTMAEHLRQGEIAPVPHRSPGMSPCSYCTFADLCGKADLTTPSALTKEEKWAALDAVFGKEETDDADLDSTAE